MRRVAILALSVWIAVIASTGLFTLFWRIGYFRPHVLWGILSLAAMLIPMAWLAACALWRSVRGPCRLRAVGWLLVGATPLVWCGAYLTQLNIDVHAGPYYPKNAPVRVAGVWASWIPDVEARWRYPRWTRGRQCVLIDDGRTPSPEKLVAEMDDHIQAMADLLGQPVPNLEFPWVRGPLFGFHGRAMYLWAICECDQAENPGELNYTDRHEVAHTLITGLSGPGHEPPYVLIEGWAESQSRDRDDLLGYLAKKRGDGRAYSLGTFVEASLYSRSNSPSYWEGGPLVLYLMEHYGGETFFRLYSGARRDSFHNDCRAILGDSWETVEAGFWRWLEAEAKPPAEPHEEQPDVAPAVQVELAPSVDPAEWQALVDGYREANQPSGPLPSNAAFVLEMERIETKSETPRSAKCTEHEFHAVFEGDRFWIFDNFLYGADCFLIGKPVHNPELLRWGSDSLEHETLHKASGLLECYRAGADPSEFLPLGENATGEGTWHIERLLRPTEGSAGKWNVWFTKRYAEAEPEVRCQLELDPEHRWRITKGVREQRGEYSLEMDAEYERLGDALMPVAQHLRRADKEGEVTVHQRVRPMSQAERQRFKRRVERAPRLGLDPFRRWRSFLSAIGIACLLVGATLLGITPRENRTQR